MVVTSRIKTIVGAAALVGILATLANWSTITSSLAPPPAPLQKLTIAANNVYIGSSLLYLAAAKGHFFEEGLDVTLQPHASGADALNAALDQQADLGTAANIPVMLATMNERPAAIVATIFTARGVNGVVARRDRGISTVADLKGKVIGVTVGTDSQFVLSTMLTRQRLSSDQVRIVNIRPGNSAEALQSGKVDAVSTWEPWVTAAKKSIGENGIEFHAESAFMANFNLVGRTDWVKANPDVVQRLLRAILRSKRFADEHPQEAAKILVETLKIDPSAIDAIGTNYRFVVQLDQSLLVTLEDQARWAIENKMTAQTVVPNFLSTIAVDALLAVKPDAVTIVR
jgi:NitT/TauT family transport system substrate-binding protein